MKMSSSMKVSCHRFPEVDTGAVTISRSDAFSKQQRACWTGGNDPK